MKHTAVLRTESKDAGSVSCALDVDNEKLDGLKIRTRRDGKAVVTEIESKSLKTLASTLDDLVRCQMAAEGSLQAKKTRQNG